MTTVPQCVRLTTAQAIVRYLAAQFIEIDGRETRVCGGGFGIFGHGNVPCLGEPLYAARDTLPLYRGQNEQSMGFAAAAYAKYHLRQRFMFCTASAGPGTANLLTAAALAHANRLPVLLLCGDTFITRLPDPVLQQLEHFGNPTLGVNDAFKAVSRFWDRITHPAQILQSLPAALATMLDPADCGPAFIGLPQDVQGWSFDYPVQFFERRVHRIRRPAPDVREIKDAAALLSSARRPVLIAGGGAQYSRAVEELTAFAETHGIPVVETIAGRANMLANHPLNIGPIGVTGSDSANTVASKADVIVAVGTRLQDFTTGSWTAFSHDARILTINVGRHDAGKHLRIVRRGRRQTFADRRYGERWATIERRRIGPRPKPMRNAPNGMEYVERQTSRIGNRSEFLRPSHRRGERYCAIRVTAWWRPPGPARRGDRQLAHAGYRHGRRRVRLLLHGLRNRRRLGRPHRAVRNGAGQATQSSLSATAAIC